MKRIIFSLLLTALMVPVSMPAHAAGEPSERKAAAAPPRSALTPAASSTSASREEEVNILIVYHSLTGNTEAMARGVKEGAEKVPGVIATMKKVDKVTRTDLRTADGLVLGSPTWYANMAGPMKKFIDDWAFQYGLFLGDKVGGAFATGNSQTGGKEHVVISLLLAMMNNGMIIVGPHHELGGIHFGSFGASAMTGPPDVGVSKAELEDARKLGERVATVALRLKRGSL
jgi:NAD(P)H dehydrogenase (quinone)